ncbi:PAS domain S-box protein [Haloarculaceae archaeon H-GB2-1]|nr:PAS domain S-box protein [Haloarculaceae archaeon H-GB2-1]
MVVTARDVSGRKQIERALSTEHQFVQHLFDTSPVAKTVLDTDGTIVQANKRAEELLGLPRSEIAGRAYDETDWNIVDEDGTPIPSEDLPFSVAMRTGEAVFGSELGVEGPDGETVWLSVNVAPTRSTEGDVEFAVASMADISEQKRLQRELEQSEELHRTTLNNITDTVFITDDDGRFTYVCPNVHYIFEYSAAEVEAMDSVAEILGSDPAPDEFGHGDVVENVELVVTDADGTDHTVLVTVTSVAIQNGSRLYSIRDVTQRVQYERALQETHASRTFALEAADAGIWEWTVGEKDVHWDSTCERLFGLERGAFEGTVDAFMGYVHPDDRAEVQAAIQTTLEEGRPFAMTYRIVRADGVERWIDGRGTVRTDDEDGGRTMIGVSIDVTAREERIQQLRVLDTVLRHNFHNDMNVIRGYAETVSEEAPDPFSAYADRVIAQCDHLLDVTDKEKAITELLSSEPMRERIDLSEAAHDVVERARKRHPHAIIEIDAPAGATAVVSHTIDEALTELVENAVEHSDRETPTISVELTADPDAVEVAVRDDGPGIPEIEREVVLGDRPIEPLYHGSGLGLWLATWIVSRSNGTLSFGSNDPRGSVVTMTFVDRHS